MPFLHLGTHLSASLFTLVLAHYHPFWAHSHSSVGPGALCLVEKWPGLPLRLLLQPMGSPPYFFDRDGYAIWLWCQSINILCSVALSPCLFIAKEEEEKSLYSI